MVSTRILRRGLCPFLAALMLGLAVGCGREDSLRPEQLAFDEHASGNNQSAMHGEALPFPLRAVVQGPARRGWLGAKGSSRVVPGITVRFSIDDPGSGAIFENTRTPTTDVISNAAGVAAARLRLGRRSGDVIVTASIPDHPQVVPIQFRAITGVERIGQDLEAITGGAIPAFGVRLEDPDGRPAEGVTVYFQTQEDADGNGVGRDHVLTDKNGVAVTSWTLGDKVGRYYAWVEIRDTREKAPARDRFDARALQFTAMALNKRTMVVILLGGLALFLFGMKLMSDGLHHAAGRRLKNILQAVTRHPFLGVLVGTAITGVIQSSSATTVMMVGFVNAGLLTLQQAIGVVYGANIGTTVTAQIIAFRLDALAYPAIALGLLMGAFARRPAVKAGGTAALGFGLLFLGMTTMSGVLEPLRHSPEFVSLFRSFDCTPGPDGIVKAWPAFMCIAIGTLTTMIIQSSSATVGLVLVLAGQGLVSFYTAAPLVLGDNIGTTITAVLASLGANRNAKRTALAHTLFNVFGAFYMYLLLFLPWWNGHPVFLGLVGAITPGDAFAEVPENLVRHVANFHTAAKVVNCIIFLPFINQMVRLCQTIIPVTDADKETVLEYLEPKLLNTPSVALQQAVKEVIYMVRKGQNSMNECCDLLCDDRRELEAKILEREELIDRLQQEITQYLVELSRERLTPSESALIPALIHAVNDAERLGDHAEELVELHRLLRDQKHKITKRGLKGLRDFQAALNRQFETIYQILDTADPSGITTAIKTEAELTALTKELTDRHIERLDEGKCDVQAGVIFLDALAHLERVGDHLLNIAERTEAILHVMRG